MKKTVRGFTLIELLVTMSIIGILFGIGFAKYNEFNRRQILAQTAQELKNNLRLAQNKALAGEKPTTGCTTLDGYQVNFSSGTPDSYTIQAKCSEGPVGTAKTFKLPSTVKFTSPPSPILFKVLAQGVEGASTITLRFSGVGDEAVTVTETGEIK